MKTIFVLLVVLLIGTSSQQCSLGCLRCNASNQCSLCDIVNMYFLNGNTCQLSTQTNCLLIAQNGNCAQCNQGFYVDTNSQRCLSVTTANSVNNCRLYSGSQVCLACSGNFFLNGLGCTAVNVTVANCQLYTGNGVCLTCAPGFILSNDFSSCVVIPNNSNCLFYTFINCRSCSRGSINNPNLYLTSFNSPNFIHNNFLVYQVMPSNFWVGMNVCQTTNVLNCASFSAFNVCIQCNAGFYVQNGNCLAFPLQTINGCLTYITLVTCSVCSPGMFLNSNVCITNLVIPNCSAYSGSASTTTCTQCTNNFFLQGNNCVQRVFSVNIMNCVVQTVGLDSCTTCGQNFQLTTDGRACLAVIPNCAAYTVSSGTTQTLVCSLCNDGFFISVTGTATSCTTGSVQFCAVYRVISNTCITCVNGYYLVNNVCLIHVVIANCQVYDQVLANSCSTCNTGFYNFVYTTVCVPSTLKTNCLTYTFDGNSCMNCQVGYYLVAGSCQIIPSTFANCASFSGTVCTLCNSGFMVNPLSSFACTAPLDYVTMATNSACALIQVTPAAFTPTWIPASTLTQSQLVCGTCNNFMYGYNPQGAEAICVNSNQLSLYQGFKLVVNCQRYGFNYAVSPSIVCMQCATNFFISGYESLAQNSVGLTCVSSCSNANLGPTVIPDDGLGFMNICIPYSNSAGTAVFTTTMLNQATGTAPFESPCFRAVRFATANIATPSTAKTQNNDYVCLLPQTNPTGTTNINTLLINVGVSNQAYNYETPSQSTALTASTDFNQGFSNTVDVNSLVPSIFNYKGLDMYIKAVIYTAGTSIPSINAANIALTNVVSYGNNLNNCDIVGNINTGFGPALPSGSAMSVHPTITSMYKVATAATDNYFCYRCKFGFQPSFSLGTTPAANQALPSCAQMSNCLSQNTVYGGLPVFLNGLLSCHVCSQTNGANTFPTLYIETTGLIAGAAGIFIDYTVTGVFTPVTGVAIVNANHGFRCAAAPSVVTVTDSSATSAINNCAVYGALTSVTVYPTTTSAGLAGIVYNVCLACAANFFPSYLGSATGALAVGFNTLTTTGLPGWVVGSCTASANCDSTANTQFNSCGRCRTDRENALVPQYYAFVDFTVSNCYQSLSQNCFILTASSFSNAASTNACWVCKAGYFLNTDVICELYIVPNQINTSPFVNAYLANKIYSNTLTATPVAQSLTSTDMNVRLHYLLSFKQSQYGASSCASGWVQFPVNPWVPRVCVWSSYVYNYTSNYPTGSNFVTNCVRYNLTQANSKNICWGCATGFLPTGDGTACVVQGTNSNCLVAQTGTNSAMCMQCVAGFNNVGGVCSSAAIANCATYINGPWTFALSILQCSACVPGFVLSTDALSCSSGSIANCVTYAQANPTACTACSAGFVLLNLSANFYCYPIPSSLNCAIMQSTSTTSGANLATVSCAACLANSNFVFGGRTWNTMPILALAQTLCMPFVPIANCQSYSQTSPMLKLNTFRCTRCNAGFWWNSATMLCVPRVNSPSVCTNLAINSDVCTACANGSFLSANGQQCVSFPTGIFQCNQYSTAVNCTRCNPGYFLSNNACIQSVLVPNCAIYSANFTCSNCNQGFFPVNASSCVVSAALNCLSYNSITACASCANSFGLLTANGVTSCVMPSLPNCLNATIIAPFTCLVCVTGFFPSTSGVCTIVQSIIANCLTYDSSITCSVCASTSVLSVARTVCNSTFYSNMIDSNCAQSFLTPTPVCYECALGSFFVNNTCVSCNVNTLAQGCLTCDPLNINSCLLCRPGYFMNAQGLCFANAPVPMVTPGSPVPINSTSSLTTAVVASLTFVTLFVDQL